MKRELIKQDPRNDKTRFRVFTMQGYSIAKAHFGLGLVSLGESGFGGFRWVSRGIIYLYICIIFACRVRERK